MTLPIAAHGELVGTLEAEREPQGGVEALLERGTEGRLMCHPCAMLASTSFRP